MGFPERRRSTASRKPTETATATRRQRCQQVVRPRGACESSRHVPVAAELATCRVGRAPKRSFQFETGLR